jgi:GntR family transcriptional repressor for pyruvate dehydrogenase complex
LRECYEFRITLEPRAAASAATHRSDATLAEIADALDLMRRATAAHAHREDADFAFHSAIARASGNRYFATALDALKDTVAVGMRLHGASVKAAPYGLEEVLTEHGAIFEAIRDGDGAAAFARMETHLTGSRHRALRAFGEGA